ncbi:unnamed protein product [Effrenium voratum]|uniref:Uncharacterized protein n=1 Tax=Effrenium voratum TaxID=2562239 RepID=A0AA36I9Z0_9DINO|nr:unnamed protein product [Effrenium voratum]
MVAEHGVPICRPQLCRRSSAEEPQQRTGETTPFARWSRLACQGCARGQQCPGVGAMCIRPERWVTAEAERVLEDSHRAQVTRWHPVRGGVASYAAPVRWWFGTSARADITGAARGPARTICRMLCRWARTAQSTLPHLAIMSTDSYVTLGPGTYNAHTTSFVYWPEALIRVRQKVT